MTRYELQRLTDTELLVHYDGLRMRIQRDWDRGLSGSLMDVMNLALAAVELRLRGISDRPVSVADQLELGFADESPTPRAPLR